jgi:hypothetical protein
MDRRRRTEVFCLGCARKETDNGKLLFYEAYKMHPVFYVYKGRRHIFGYVCPYCGNIFRTAMPPLKEEPHIIYPEKAVVSETEKIIIPTERTQSFDEIYEKIYRKIRKSWEQTTNKVKCSNNYCRRG